MANRKPIKLSVSLGDDLNKANVTFKNPIPVTHNFNSHNPLGMAELKYEKDEMIAEVTIPNETIKAGLWDRLYLAVGGLVTDRTEKYITAFEIREVSLTLSSEANPESRINHREFNQEEE